MPTVSDKISSHLNELAGKRFTKYWADFHLAKVLEDIKLQEETPGGSTPYNSNISLSSGSAGPLAGPGASGVPFIQPEGRKDDEGKLRYDLIPGYPLSKVAEVYTIGAKKYADWNWSKGMKWHRIFRAIMSHLWAFWWKRESIDPDNGQHHLAAAVFGCLTLMDYEVHHPELDDREGR